MTDPPARVRRLLECLGGAVTVASAVLWAWVARGLHGDVAITGLVGAAGLSALLLPGGRVRRAGAVLLFVVAALRIAAFYGERGHGEETTGRLALLPAGRALLTVTVFLVLYQHVLLALPWMGRLSRGRRGLLLTLGLVSSTAIAADLHFLPDRIGDFQRLRFHPFLTLHAADSYKYAHAQERRVRDLRNVVFSQRKPRDTLRIVLMGASTMQGIYNSDESCPAARLQHHLRAAEPDRSYEVLTLAETGKFQLNELIDAAVTLPHWDPDLVVSWNGFNEVWYGEEDHTYEGRPAFGPEVEASVEASAVEAWFYEHSFLGGRLFQQTATELWFRYTLKDRDAYEPPRYYGYLRREARLLAGAGIRYVYSFCPNVAEKSPRSPEERGQPLPWEKLTDQVAERRRLSAQIVREEGQFSYDVMESLKGTGQTLFVDRCHLNDEGVDRAARDLAARVPGWLQAPKPSSHPGTAE